MDDSARERQREARRQKVLARTQDGSRAPVIDLAAQESEIAPQDSITNVDEANLPAVAASEDSRKSASRVAAERRRQRILSKSTERMAKVQGGRTIRQATDDADGGASADASASAEGGGEGVGVADSLDDMLDAAEVEFFGADSEGGDVAESKPAARQQAYFKSSRRGESGGREASSKASPAATAQSKAAQERAAASVSSKTARAATSSRHIVPASERVSSRRPTGNKALDKQAFDLAAIESLARAAGADKNKANKSSNRWRTLGGARFWGSLESMTKACLLLLIGIGVGGLLLPEGRAAVAHAKYEAEYMQNMDSRSKLESLLAGSGVETGSHRDPSAFDVTFEDSDSAELKGPSPKDEHDLTGGDMASTREGTEGNVVWVLANGFLALVDFLVGWTHYLTRALPPWRERNHPFCVPAIYLAVLVRLVVATIFASVRLVLGLPVASSAAASSKPGMVMGMILASVPMVGKVLALGSIIKSILSDTTLVVAGTVLTLAFSLWAEEDTGPRRFAESMAGVVARSFVSTGDDLSSKEL